MGSDDGKVDDHASQQVDLDQVDRQVKALEEAEGTPAESGSVSTEPFSFEDIELPGSNETEDLPEIAKTEDSSLEIGIEEETAKGIDNFYSAYVLDGPENDMIAVDEGLTGRGYVFRNEMKKLGDRLASTERFETLDIGNKNQEISRNEAISRLAAQYDPSKEIESVIETLSGVSENQIVADGSRIMTLMAYNASNEVGVGEISNSLGIDSDRVYEIAQSLTDYEGVGHGLLEERNGQYVITKEGEMASEFIKNFADRAYNKI